MDQTRAAYGLNALGNETRLAIFRLLVKAGQPGLTIGRIGSETGVPLSTLAHHLDRLVRAGLVEQRREGREVYCMANFATLRRLTDYLTDECCKGLPETSTRREHIEETA